MIKIPSISLILAIFSCSFANAQVYKWVDKEGVTHFTEQAPNQSQVYSGDVDTSRVNQNQMAEKDDYLQTRAVLEEQISGTINSQRRNQLKRQLNNLDYSWYKEYDPTKAEQLKAQMDKPKIRVVPKEGEKSKMKQMGAFY